MNRPVSAKEDDIATDQVGTGKVEEQEGDKRCNHQ